MGWFLKLVGHDGRKQVIDRYRGVFSDRQKFNGEQLTDSEEGEEGLFINWIQEAMAIINEKLDGARISIENNSKRKKKGSLERPEKTQSNLKDALDCLDQLFKIIEPRPKICEKYVLLSDSPEIIDDRNPK